MRALKVAQQADDIREKIFLTIIDHLWRLDGDAIKDLAESARVHYTTLYNWRNAVTIAPKISTLVRVSYCLGYHITLTPIKKTQLRRIK